MVSLQKCKNSIFERFRTCFFQSFFISYFFDLKSVCSRAEILSLLKLGTLQEGGFGDFDLYRALKTTKFSCLRRAFCVAEKNTTTRSKISLSNYIIYYKRNFILQVLQMKDLRFRDGTNGIFAYKIAPQAIFQFQDAANGFYLAK